MRYVKWTLILVLGAALWGFLNYTLPSHDIVRIVGTDNRRMDFGENSWFWAAPDVGTVKGTNRDVFFINAVYPDGRTMEYRNEDTGWGWPPYFKMNSFSLQTQAKELISTADAPRWVMVTRYGWRSPLLTIFPNALAVAPVSGPDVRVIPWATIIVLALLAAVALLFWRIWVQFRERVIEPAAIEAEITLDRMGDGAERARGWLARLFRRK